MAAATTGCCGGAAVPRCGAGRHGGCAAADPRVLGGGGTGWRSAAARPRLGGCAQRLLRTRGCWVAAARAGARPPPGHGTGAVLSGCCGPAGAGWRRHGLALGRGTGAGLLLTRGCWVAGALAGARLPPGCGTGAGLLRTAGAGWRRHGLALGRRPATARGLCCCGPAGAGLALCCRPAAAAQHGGWLGWAAADQRVLGWRSDAARLQHGGWAAVDPRVLRGGSRFAAARRPRPRHGAGAAPLAAQAKSCGVSDNNTPAKSCPTPPRRLSIAPDPLLATLLLCAVTPTLTRSDPLLDTLLHHIVTPTITPSLTSLLAPSLPAHSDSQTIPRF